MALTLRQFLYIRAQLEDLYYLRALHEVFYGTIAAWGDSGPRRRLERCADRLSGDGKTPMPPYTPEAEELAKRRAEEYFRSKHGEA